MTIFISYARENEEISKELENRLSQEGLIVYRDKTILKTGDDWESQLLSRIKSSRYFIVLWSQYASKSKQVLAEILEAFKSKCRILPCKLDETDLLPLLQDINYLEINDINKQFDDLISELEIEEENYSGEKTGDLNYAISNYKREILKRYNYLRVLFEGKEKDILETYIQLYFTQGLEYDADIGGIYTDKLFELVIKNFDKIIIAGHPGTGKTSTLHYLMYKWGESEQNNLFIYSELKNFEGYHESLSQFITEQFYKTTKPNVRKIFQDSEIFQDFNCIILIDGLDELPAGTYVQFYEYLEDFIRNHRDTKFIITSRIDGFKDSREEDFLKWDIYSISQLSPTNIEEFINDWFEGDKESAEILIEKLKVPRLAELAKRAFLLTLICLVFEENRDLGKNRSELYSQATKYLEQSRTLRYPSKVINIRNKVLKEIALKFLQLNSQELPQDLIFAIASNVIPNDFKDSTKEFSTKDFINSLTADTGILQQQGSNYLFPHKSFQEYYAAIALKDLPHGENLILDYCQVSHWEEPIRLYAGSIENGKKQEELLSSLWRKNPGLSLRSAAECHSIGPRFIGNIIKKSNKNNRLKMLNDIRSSLYTVNSDEAKKLTIETLKPLFSVEHDASVLYNGLELLKEFDPEDEGEIVYNTFKKDSEILFDKISSDPKYNFSFKEVNAGSFIMGDEDAMDEMEKPAHRVVLDRFQICQFQLTNLAYEAIMGAEYSKRDESFSNKDNQPVANLNWFEAYICALKVGCRLPTEAEWEYAARAGSTSNWCYGNDQSKLTKYANYEDSGVNTTWAVGTGEPNNWDLYDVHGNVWEWCQDWLASYSKSEKKNPTGPKTGTRKVRRGGGHAYHARGCRSAFRWGNDPSYSFKDIGVRLVRNL